jgi:hypothetical protein
MRALIVFAWDILIDVQVCRVSWRVESVEMSFQTGSC